MFDLGRALWAPAGIPINVSDDVNLPSPSNGQFQWGPSPYSDEEIEERARRVIESKIDFEEPTAGPDCGGASAENGVGGPSRAGNTIPPGPEQPNDTILPPPITVIDPAHYRSHPSGVECIEITEHMNFCVGNAIKYLWRAGLKPEADAQDDLRKARWYVQRELKRLGYDVD